MSLTIRRILVVVAALIIAASFVISNRMVESKQPPPRKPAPSIVRTVDTFIVHNSSIPTTLEVQGDLVAFDKIDIFTEVSGTLGATSRPFKEGSYFPKGSVLIKIDATEAKLSVQAQKSTLLNAITQMMPDLKIDYPQSFDHWKTYLDNFDLAQTLPPFPEPVDNQEKLFIASRNLYNQYYSIKSTEERLSKYVIKAPFSGVITEATINPGALVRAGQKLGVLMNTSNYEMEATVALKDLKYIKVGNRVKLNSEDIEGNWSGRVKRINDQIDPNTQTITVFVSVSGNNLREGMYLRGDIEASQIDNAVRIPKDLLIEQSAVYAVNDTTLELHPVEVVKVTENDAILRGIKDGTPLLKETFPGIFEGMSVKVSGRSSSDPDQDNSTNPAISSKLNQ